jgi:CobQ-like glutamine amidotransferase family enzyme
LKIEVLFPELCNLYGDLFNVRLLKHSYPEIEIINTSLKSEPLFATEMPDMIYMGSTTERGQELVAEKLLPHRGRLLDLIDNDALILLTGNATEIFGEYIELESGQRIECLGVLPAYAKRQMMARYNSLYVGKFGETDIVGFKSQFSHSYGDNSDCYFINTLKGAGLNPDVMTEGFRVKNLHCTYLLGPVLLINPPLAKYFLQVMDVNKPKLRFEKACYDSYMARIEEFNEPGKRIEN